MVKFYQMSVILTDISELKRNTVRIHLNNEFCLIFQILDTNPRLYFHLQQQRMIELIRDSKWEEALQFAQEELVPRGEENVICFCHVT